MPNIEYNTMMRPHVKTYSFYIMQSKNIIPNTVRFVVQITLYQSLNALYRTLKQLFRLLLCLPYLFEIKSNYVKHIQIAQRQTYETMQYSNCVSISHNSKHNCYNCMSDMHNIRRTYIIV